MGSVATTIASTVPPGWIGRQVSVEAPGDRVASGYLSDTERVHPAVVRVYLGGHYVDVASTSKVTTRVRHGEVTP